MDPNNELILKITRKFEEIIDKILVQPEAQTVLDEIRSGRAKPQKNIVYYKPKLIAEEDIDEIGRYFRDQQVISLDSGEPPNNLKDILNLI